MREWDGRDGGRTERESKERDALTEVTIMGLAINLAQGNSQESTDTLS